MVSIQEWFLIKSGLPWRAYIFLPPWLQFHRSVAVGSTKRALEEAHSFINCQTFRDPWERPFEGQLVLLEIQALLVHQAYREIQEVQKEEVNSADSLQT
jgi:hypothetical protein